MPKKIEDKEIEKDLDQEENPSEKIAELTVKIDELSEEIESLKNTNKELDTKYKDEHNANLRLMDRIYKKDEANDNRLIRERKEPARLSDYMDKNGRLNFNK